MLQRTNRKVDVWPPDYVSAFKERERRLMLIRKDPVLAWGSTEYYRERPVDFVCDWGITYDPRNAGSDLPENMPFIMFTRQRQLTEFLMACVREECNGLVEKCRDMGATWVCVALSVWLWRYWPGVAVGWGSRKEPLVDRLGDADSIFEKIRIFIRNMPPEFWPAGFDPETHMPSMRILNPENKASITGEVGDNIGRGGRKRVYFKDESAHYERPEKIEAALADNTRVQIDISSVNGPSNVFHRKRDGGTEWEPGQKLRRDRANVFIMDWRDHPGKSQQWYDDRRASAESAGLLHVFAQEVDRDYNAAVDGVIIPSLWVESAIDADQKLWLKDAELGPAYAALDVADGGGDLNAVARRKGIVLNYLEEWGERDTGVSARKTVMMVKGHAPIKVQYDCIGVGSGIKAEINRLDLDEKILPQGVRFTPWDAGAGCLFPKEHVERRDKQTPLNEDFYANLKAQGWWQLRRRFEKTHNAVTKGVEYPTGDLISIPSTIPKLRTLKKELSQPTMGQSGNLRLLVNKTPNGTRSPNIGDAVMMCYWPADQRRYTLDNVR